MRRRARCSRAMTIHSTIRAFVVTNDANDSKKIKDAPRPYMIVASNGMLTGGRVLHHLRDLIDDPTATLLFVGYQGEGTLGAHLQSGAKDTRIDGQSRPVRCRVVSISGFSAHADERSYSIGSASSRRASSPATRVSEARVHRPWRSADEPAIEPKIKALGFDTHIPVWGES